MASVAATSPIVALLKYADLEQAVSWLVTVAGLQVDSYEDSEPFAVLRSGTGIMFAQQDPTATAMTGGRLYLYVGDVDAHHQRAVAAGIDEPAPQDMPWGDRVWNTVDPQGHPWTFAAS
jgi:uncharacterized glyoxalase superfamily protein PhnB